MLAANAQVLQLWVQICLDLLPCLALDFALRQRCSSAKTSRNLVSSAAASILDSFALIAQLYVHCCHVFCLATLCPLGFLYAMHAALRHTDSFMLVAELAALQCKSVPSGAYLNSLRPILLGLSWHGVPQ